MEDIIKTKLHPDGDKYTILHPETSIDQIVDYEKPELYIHIVRLYNQWCYIFFNILSSNSNKLTFDEINQYISNIYYTCTGIHINSNKIALNIRGIGNSIYVDLGNGATYSFVNENATIDDTVKKIL